MSGAEGRASGLAWTAGSLVGIAAWLGATVLAAATNPDPSDPAPILRTFAVGGGIFIGIVLVAAGLDARRRAARVSTSLYARLVVGDLPPGAVRAAIRGARSGLSAYLVLTGLTTGLMLAAVGLGQDGPTALLLYVALGLVVVWLGVMVRSLAHAYRAADGVLAPLGLALTALPSWAPALLGSPRTLHGPLGIGGERHGRAVSILQRPAMAVTVVEGRFARSTMSSAAAMSALTGEPPRFFRRVEAEVGPRQVTVRRTGNGAGRHMFHDLLLAEALATRGEARGAGGPPG